jgi:T5SS/PEP-CTERM-associated repeat protein
MNRAHTRSPVQRPRLLLLPALLLASAPAWPAVASDGPLVLFPQTAAPFPAGEWLVANEPSFGSQPIQLFRLEAGLTESNEYFSAGANVGNLPHQQFLAPSQGRVELGAGQTWVNEGRFWVGSHFGIQNSMGEVVFESGSQFVSSAVATTFPELPKDVRIGQGGAGTVVVQPGAIWLNEGLPNFVSFTVGDQGFLDIQGELLSDANSVISGGSAWVRGPGALWQVGGFGLDIEGFGQPGTLRVSDGGVVNDMGFAQVGFSSNSSGQLFVGNEPVFVAFGFDDEDEELARSLFSASILEMGVFAGATGYVQVDQGGRLDIAAQIRMGRAGGTGELVINEGGEVLVGGFFAGGFLGQSVELWPGSTIDLSGGGKLVIGTDTTPLDEPVPGTGNAFDDIDAGTLLVGQGGQLRGSGLVIGDVLIGSGGQLAPGNSPGLFSIDGNLTLEDGGLLLIEIAGGGPGQYDQVDVSGLITLGGTLELLFINDFAPGDGEGFSLDIFSGALAGSFAEVVISGFSGPLQFDLGALLTGQATSFTVVPVPAAVWLFASALGLLSFARRRA